MKRRVNVKGIHRHQSNHTMQPESESKDTGRDGKRQNGEQCSEEKKEMKTQLVSSCRSFVPRIRLLIPSRLTNTLSISSLPVNSSAITYRLGLTALAASSMAWTRQYISVTHRERRRVCCYHRHTYLQYAARLAFSNGCCFPTFTCYFLLILLKQFLFQAEIYKYDSNKNTNDTDNNSKILVFIRRILCCIALEYAAPSFKLCNNLMTHENTSATCNGVEWQLSSLTPWKYLAVFSVYFFMWAHRYGQSSGPLP